MVGEFEKYHKRYNSKSTDGVKSLEDEGGKECTNLIVLISELYNFQVISCVLVYDLIKLFISDLSELNVELLLKVIRSKLYFNKNCAYIENNYPNFVYYRFWVST